jgi:hypothetical protein
LFFICLGTRYVLGDVGLFVLGVTGQTNDLHAVEQRPGDVHAVGRGHEHGIRQVEIHFQVMVVEGGVLLRVQDLQQGRRRVAAEIHGHLVDLIQQEQRVARAHLGQVLHDLARQRADVGAAVAADLGLVAHPAQ